MLGGKKEKKNAFICDTSFPLQLIFRALRQNNVKVACRVLSKQVVSSPAFLIWSELGGHAWAIPCSFLVGYTVSMTAGNLWEYHAREEKEPDFWILRFFKKPNLYFLL